jgi:hypothetical protein
MTYDFEDLLTGNFIDNLIDNLVGKIKDPISLTTREENRVATYTLVQQAKRTIHIFSHQLDPLIYGEKRLVDAIAQLAIRSRHSKIHILVKETQAMTKNGHRIIEIARRVSSNIQIRKVNEDYQNIAYAFCAVDEIGLIYQKVATRYEANLDFHASKEARTLIKKFNEIWRKSSPEPMLKHLNI